MGGFALRKKIRETWASPETSARNNLRTLFFMGSSSDKTLMEKVKNESKLHHDIIQKSFVDSYHNLTLKHNAALKFFHTYCPMGSYSFLMKTDDDMVLDVDSITSYMKVKANVTIAPQRTMYCFYITWYVHRTIPHNLGNKWYVSPEEYPGHSYPAYCRGIGYLMTQDLANALYNMSLYTRDLWIDDVHIGGMLMRNLRNASFLVVPGPRSEAKGIQPEQVLQRRTWLVHGVGDPAMFDDNWPVYQSRWNLTVRDHIRKMVEKEKNLTLDDSMFSNQ